MRENFRLVGFLAGMNWSNSTNCRSQSQNANNYRWNTNTNNTCRGHTDTGFEQLLAEPIGPVSMVGAKYEKGERK